MTHCLITYVFIKSDYAESLEGYYSAGNWLSKLNAANSIMTP